MALSRPWNRKSAETKIMKRKKSKLCWKTSTKSHFNTLFAYDEKIKFRYTQTKQFLKPFRMFKIWNSSIKNFQFLNNLFQIKKILFRFGHYSHWEIYLKKKPKKPNVWKTVIQNSKRHSQSSYNRIRSMKMHIWCILKREMTNAHVSTTHDDESWTLHFRLHTKNTIIRFSFFFSRSSFTEAICKYALGDYYESPRVLNHYERLIA